jgi:hypothetical protein
MGTHREQIVDISTSAGDAETRAAAVRAWLEAAGWAVPAEIARSLRAELAAALGGRWAYVHHHL